MNRFFIPSLFALSVLTACQTTDFEQIVSERSEVESRLPESWQVSLEQGSIPQDWTELFDDPLLSSYMKQAETKNPDIARAVINVRQSESALKQTRAILLPILTTDAGISGVTGLRNINISESFSDGLSASYNPGLFGRNRIQIDQAEALLDVTQANRERIRRVVMAQIARLYVQIIETEYQLDLARENLDFIGETLRISEARFREGDIARDQFALAQLETFNAEASVATLEASARTLRRNLAVLIGNTPDANLQVAANLPAPADLNLSILPAELLGRRFDVVASRAAIASSFTNFEQAERLNWPNLSFSGRLSGGGFDIEDLFDIDSYFANLGGSLAATLYDGGRKEASIEIARAGLDQTLINYDEVLRNALLDVETGFDQIAAAQRSLAALEKASDAAGKALELEKIKYDLGESIILDVLTVQRRVNAILSTYISTRSRLLDAQIDTYLALGGDVTQ